MNELLTPEDKKYLERVSRYVQSLGKKQVEIRIEANDWDNKAEISEIEWEHVTNFDWDSRLEIPSGFIEILQKIFNYIDESGDYAFPDIEGINYNDFLIDFDASNKELTIRHLYGYYDAGSESEVDFEGDDVDMDSFRNELESNNVEIPYFSGFNSNGFLRNKPKRDVTRDSITYGQFLVYDHALTQRVSFVCPCSLWPVHA